MSEATKHPNLFAALSAAQAEFHTLTKDSENPHFHSKFAGLDTIVEQTRPVLTTHGLSFMGKPSFDEQGRPTLKYTLGHESGEREDGEMLLLVAKQDPQGQGSGLTYARRYAICAVLNLVADEDDDGENASAPAPKSKVKAKPDTPAADATIPETEVKALAALYAATGWKDTDPKAEDPHAFLRLQLATVGAGNEGDVKDCIRALNLSQGKVVRRALEVARDKEAAKS